MGSGRAAFCEACRLRGRSLIFVRGDDRFKFLQPLISNDLSAVESGGFIWAAHLTAQGKFSYDLLIGSFGDVVILEVESAWASKFCELLLGYRLSADVEVAMGSEFGVWALAGGECSEDVGSHGYGLFFVDPRSADLGYRFWGRDDDFGLFCRDRAIALYDDENFYHSRRIGLFIPENSQAEHLDLLRGKTLLLEAGFDAFGGISWDKGCYVGQELTARTKYRGLVKRCLVGVCGEGSFAEDSITDSGGKFIGDLRSRGILSDGCHVALAGMRLGDWEGSLFCGAMEVRVSVPSFIEHERLA